MPSLNTWSKSIEVEGRRVIEDLESGKKSLAKLLAPIDDYNRGKKKKFLHGKHFIKGYHEDPPSGATNDKCGQSDWAPSGTLKSQIAICVSKS